MTCANCGAAWGYQIVSCNNCGHQERADADAKDAERYRWLIANQDFGKADNAGNAWMNLKGYSPDAQPINGGWFVKKPDLDKYIDALINPQITAK